MGDRSSHRRRGLRRVVIAAVALVALAGTGVLALPEIARRVVVWRVAAMTGRPVTLAALELDLLGGRLALRGGAVTIEDRTLAPAHAWRVEAATLEVRGVSTLPEAPPGVVTLGAVAAGSPISLWLGGVRLAPLRFHATVIAREIDASLA